MRKINYHFEISETGKYLAFEVGEQQKPLWHQVEMISNNSELDLILPLYMEKQDKCYFSYKLEEGMETSLAEYFAQNQIDSISFCKFIRNTLVKIFESENYLLDKNGFLLSPDLIFVKGGILDVSYIYFPCKSNADINVEMREMIADLLTSRVVFSAGGEFLIATLLNYYKSHDFNLYGLAEVCEGLIREKSEVESPPSQQIYVERPIETEEIIDHVANTSRPDLVMQMQFVFIVLAVIVFVTPVGRYISFLGENSNLLLLLIIGGIDGLLVLILKMSKKISKPKLMQIDPQDRTILLTGVKASFGHLVEKDIPNGLKFDLNELVVIVGREKDEVDLCCENMAVGKRHAQLHFHEGAYHLSDLNSKNGTFLNGARLELNQEKQIKSGDEICFANSSFVFESNFRF